MGRNTGRFRPFWGKWRLLIAPGRFSKPSKIFLISNRHMPFSIGCAGAFAIEKANDFAVLQEIDPFKNLQSAIFEPVRLQVAILSLP
jgi:hypothetical protein